MLEIKSNRRSKSKRESQRSKRKDGGEKELTDKKIDKYIDQLCQFIDKHKLNSFWLEYGQDIKERQKVGFYEVFNDIKKNPKKYAGKKLVYCQCTCFNDRKNSNEWKNGYLLRVRISIYKISKDGSFDTEDKTNNIGHLDLLWKRDDLPISKFTIALLAELIRLVYKNKLMMGSLDGFPLKLLVKELNNFEKYKIEKKFLNPLTA